MQFERISIIALGLLGGSLAAKLRQKAPSAHISAFDIDPETRLLAEKSPLIDLAAETLSQAVKDADLVIICTPVQAAAAVLADLAEHLPSCAIVTDVCSTKVGIVACAAEKFASRSDISFIGSHPIAGSQKSGFDAATETLFDGRSCIITPDSACGADAIERVEKFWAETIGMRVIRMSPENHDETFARLSHFPHLAAAMLMNMQLADELPLAGTGLADTTRIAGGGETLWTQICMSNRENLMALLDNFKNDCEKLSKILANQDNAALEEFFRSGREKRQQLG